MRPPQPSSLLVIFLSCPLIGSLSSSAANQRAAQNNYRALGIQDLFFLIFLTCTLLKRGFKGSLFAALEIRELLVDLWFCIFDVTNSLKDLSDEFLRSFAFSVI